MREQLIKAMRRNQVVDIIYMAKDGTITKRRLKLITVAGDTMQAYCFMRHAKRTFLINNILAVIPVVNKGREVV